MSNLRRAAWCLGAVMVTAGSTATEADPPADTGAQVGTTKGGFFSSLKQSFAQDLDRDVVRGHFDVGTPPDTHRFYCLVDAKNGKQLDNAVTGTLVKRKDGMTGLSGGAVSTNSCSSAEQQGLLVTTGYELKGGAVAKAVPARTVPTEMPKAADAPPAAVPAPPAGRSSDGIDVAGLRLGMSTEEARAALRSKKLLNLFESSDMAASGTFVNVMAAWTTPQAAAGEGGETGGEAYEVMFTPLPGHERVVAIVHTLGYAAGRGARLADLQDGLVRKYKGYSAGTSFPASPTWRLQRDGAVQTGDPCERRSLFGGLKELTGQLPTRPNVVVKNTPEELRSELERCGATIVTEDHALDSAAPREEHAVTRYTVSAYSPAIALEAANARRTEGGAGGKGGDHPVPVL
jgi:hypothetical protein